MEQGSDAIFDFEKFLREQYEAASPEEKARIDEYHRREDRLDQTRHGIGATFVRFSRKMVAKARSPRDASERVEAGRWQKDLSMRIEDRCPASGAEYEVLKFFGGSTGYESFELNEDFVAALNEPDGDEFWICAGNETYDGCFVSSQQVLDYIAVHRARFVKLGIAANVTTSSGRRFKEPHGF